MRILIIGFGDVGARFAHAFAARPGIQVRALVRSPVDQASPNVQFFKADLDHFRSLDRLRGAADHVVYLAPPPANGTDDPRLRRALCALGPRLRSLVYVSTTGVYGDCAGAIIDETRPLQTQSTRAKRRVAAEALLRVRPHLRAMRLRAPGIYADDRLPTQRIARGTPALTPEEDSYSNHIHADDLARACWAAIFRGRSQRAYNVTDGTHIKMGDWFDRVADAHQMPRVPRKPAAHIRAFLGEDLWSFMRESRRIGNTRLRAELRFAPRALEVSR